MSTKKEGAGTTQTPNSDLATQGATMRKYNPFAAQKRKVLKAFGQRPKTMLMVSIETGILRANICRYVAEFKKGNRLFLVDKKMCPISKHTAGYYSTNKNARPWMIIFIQE